MYAMRTVRRGGALRSCFFVFISFIHQGQSNLWGKKNRANRLVSASQVIFKEANCSQISIVELGFHVRHVPPGCSL